MVLGQCLEAIVKLLMVNKSKLNPDKMKIILVGQAEYVYGAKLCLIDQETRTSPSPGFVNG